MPVAVSYPGVYIEEIPSGVRTITGVSTSITAFVGWAPKGPTDRAERVLSWAEYERKFGGLDKRSLLGYSVYHFFNNGGSDAYIIRLAGDDAETSSRALDALTVNASSPGDWANDYAVTITRRADDAARFRLEVFRISFTPLDATNKNVEKTIVEVFENLSMNPDDARSVAKVLESESNFVRGEVDIDDPNNIPPPPANSIIPATVPVADIVVPTSLRDGKNGAVLNPNDTGTGTGGAFETALTESGGGINLLDKVDLFNILCVPGETTPTTISTLEKFCRDRRAFLIVDCAANATVNNQTGPNSSITGGDSINAAFYFPWVLAPDALQENRANEFPPCGFVAGIYARTDSSRGVWKAPAGTEASLTGVIGVKQEKNLTDAQNGVLNKLAVDCIRTFPVYGTIVWGARTLHGNDERGSEWKYIPVRRTALYIEETLYRALHWVVFEPNDEPLWSQIRLNAGAFMHNLFRQGAFQGKTPKDAYFVKCDKETTTQSDINLGIVNIHVGFAPLKPAEFVIIKIQQMAGQIEV